MDAIVGIFVSLGVNKTIFIQFAIVIALYFVLKMVLFSKLQFILELRENKTTKLEGAANKKLQEAEAMAQKYKDQLDQAHQEAYRVLNKKKEEVLSREHKIIKAKEAELNSLVETKRKESEALVATQREEVLKSVDSLSGDLVNKLIQ